MTQPNSNGDGVGERHVSEVPSGEIAITRPNELSSPKRQRAVLTSAPSPWKPRPSTYHIRQPWALRVDHDGTMRKAIKRRGFGSRVRACAIRDKRRPPVGNQSAIRAQSGRNQGAIGAQSGRNQSAIRAQSERTHRDERAASHGASGGQDAEDVRVLVVPNEARH